MITALKLDDDASEFCNCKDLTAQVRDLKVRLDRLEANITVTNNLTKNNRRDGSISLKNATDLVEQVTELRAIVLTNTQRKLHLTLNIYPLHQSGDLIDNINT